jgi:hypothetical protein
MIERPWVSSYYLTKKQKAIQEWLFSILCFCAFSREETEGNTMDINGLIDSSFCGIESATMVALSI